MTPRVSETLALLDRFDPGREDRSVSSLRATQQVLRDGSAPFDRTRYDPGHVTASGIVLAPGTSAVLLVYHRRLNRWLQPGGHVEPEDETVMQTAMREIVEETGVELTPERPTLVAVDVHEIPPGKGEPAHYHHDLMFAFRAAHRALDVGDPPARWLAVSDAAAFSGDAALARGLARALQP